VNCAQTIQDRPGQPAFGVLRTSASNLGTPFKMCDFCYCPLI